MNELKTNEDDIHLQSYKYKRVDKLKSLSQEDFFSKYDGKFPVIFLNPPGSFPASDWNEDFFREHYSDAKVHVQLARGSYREGLVMTLGEFLPLLSRGSNASWSYLQVDYLFKDMQGSLVF